MQIPQSTSQYGMLGFQLPFLHSEIPVKAAIRRRESSLAAIATDLVEIGVINPRSVPDTVDCPAHVVAHGLTDWFSKRTGNLQRVKFTVSVLGVDDALTYFDQAQHGPSRDDVIANGTPFLTIGSPEWEEPYEMHQVADLCEKAQAGLFRWVLDAIAHASYRTVAVRFPVEIYNDFACMHYDADWSEDVTDKSVWEGLMERFDDEQEAEHYLPSRIKPIFGYSHWSWTRRTKLSKKRLLAFAKFGPAGKARTIAREAVALMALTEKAKAREAKLPDLSDFELFHLYSSCCLIHQADEVVWHSLDNIIEMAMQGGDHCDLLGLHQLPADPSALKTYFENLDLALALTRQMDKVMSLVSTPVNR